MVSDCVAIHYVKPLPNAICNPHVKGKCLNRILAHRGSVGGDTAIESEFLQMIEELDIQPQVASARHQVPIPLAVIVVNVDVIRETTQGYERKCLGRILPAVNGVANIQRDAQIGTSNCITKQQRLCGRVERAVYAC